VDGVGPHAERFRRKLRQHGLRALALIGRAGGDVNLA
jgi:hypothetical protein